MLAGMGGDQIMEESDYENAVDEADEDEEDDYEDEDMEGQRTRRQSDVEMD
jgi:hypothetical protein